MLVARGRIEIQGGPIALGMQAEGVVVSVEVAEGDQVAKGQPLVTIDPTPSTIGVDLATAHLQSGHAEVVQLQGQAKAASVRAARLAAAARADAGDGQSADDAHAAAAQVTGELDKARAAVKVADAELRQARYVAAHHVLSAPEAGQVLRVSAAPGAVVSPQSGALVTLLPDRPRIVRAELGEAILAAVTQGMHASIVSDDARQTPIGS
ncbi:MAG: HlyD family efflux transporter periplasmic adaptor subunit, partial [Luteimonas sp.]